jgi:Zn-dependent protease
LTKWSLKIGRFAGIDVYVHFTFVLLITWVAFIYWRQEQNVAAAVAGVSYLLTVFLCVVLHEYGHALTAKRYGIKTRDIILLPIGGVARLERLPTNPLQELWVALAGPAVNVVIAVVLFAWLKLTETFIPLNTISMTAGPFLERIMAINIFLVAFNMIPAFPMDGGRVLRAILATKKEYSQATQIAASIGQGIAIVFGFIGMFYNPILLFIAFFVWIGAAQESGVSKLQSAISGIPVQQAMITDFKTLNHNDSLEKAIELTIAGSQKDFPVLVDGEVKGVLTQSDLLKSLSSSSINHSVMSISQEEFTTVDSLDMLEVAFARLKDCNCHTLPVTRNGQLVGLLTMDNLGEYMRIQSAIRN